MCKDTARKAIRELIEKGYIEQNEKGYEFYECPRKIQNIKPVGEKKEFVDDETGEVFLYSYSQLVSIVGKEKADILWEGDNHAKE